MHHIKEQVRDVTPVRNLRNSHEVEELLKEEKILSTKIETTKRKIVLIGEELRKMDKSDKGYAARCKVQAASRNFLTYLTKKLQKVRGRLNAAREKQLFG